MFFNYFESQGETNKDFRKLHQEIWERIGIIKSFLGITKNTRYIGEEQAEKRLCNEIDVYAKYPEALSPIHRIVLGDNTDLEKLEQFKRFLTDRRKVRSVISYQQYT